MQPIDAQHWHHPMGKPICSWFIWKEPIRQRDCIKKGVQVYGNYWAAAGGVRNPVLQTVTALQLFLPRTTTLASQRELIHVIIQLLNLQRPLQENNKGLKTHDCMLSTFLDQLKACFVLKRKDFIDHHWRLWENVFSGQLKTHTDENVVFGVFNIFVAFFSW